MKVRAIYYPKNYNAFSEYHLEGPYEITAEVPNDMTDEQIREEAAKSCAVKAGYYLQSIEILTI